MNLEEFFNRYPKIALGFSGGVDSSFLLYAALKYGANVKPYFIKTAFQPEFEYEDAMRMASELGAEVTVLRYDVEDFPEVCANPKDRCYHCKNALFKSLKKQAILDGYTTLIDGTNASDDGDDRPGMKALGELDVLSPLRLCGITKAEVRRLSKEAGLFTWDKPAYACLATRMPTGVKITKDLLKRIEMCEAELFDLGFTDFRVRYFHDAARIQLPNDQFPLALKQKDEILRRFASYFENVFLDLKER